MDAYYPYNPDSTAPVQEATTLTSTTLQLRYIPKEASVRIMGFIETNSLVVSQGHFRVDYFGASGDYRDSSRCIYFNEADIGRDVNVEYVAVGTPVTADDMNEIRDHINNTSIHKTDANAMHYVGAKSTFTTGNKIGDVMRYTPDGNYYIYSGGWYSLGGGSGNMNYRGVTYGLPSSAKTGDVCINVNDWTVYIYDNYWRKCYTPSSSSQRYRHVITLHAPATSVDIINHLAVPIFPDWDWHYVGEGFSEISLPLNITDPSQILGVYDTAGEEIPIYDMDAEDDDPFYYDEDGCDRFYRFTGPTTGRQYSIFFSDWMATKRLGYQELVPNSATIVIYYEA